MIQTVIPHSNRGNSRIWAALENSLADPFDANEILGVAQHSFLWLHTCSISGIEFPGLLDVACCRPMMAPTRLPADGADRGMSDQDFPEVAVRLAREAGLLIAGAWDSGVEEGALGNWVGSAVADAVVRLHGRAVAPRPPRRDPAVSRYLLDVTR